MGSAMNDTEQLDGADGEGRGFLDIAITVVQNAKLLILGPLAAGLVALGIAFQIPPTFTATTKFLPPQQQQSGAAAMLANLGALGGLAGAATGLKNPGDQYVAFLKSRSVLDALVMRFKLQERYGAELRSDAVEALEANSQVSSGKDGLITIAVDDKNPAMSAQLANAYVEELEKLMSRLAVTEAQQRRVFFEKQLLQTKQSLTAAEIALKNAGVSISALKMDPAAAVDVVAQLQAQITVQEVKLASMRGYLTESAPAFKQAMAELSALKAQGAKAAESSQAPQGSDADYVTRYRDFKYQATLFELFAKQFELAKIDEAKEGAVIQVVDVAQAPERKSKPKKGLIAALATVVTGLLLLMYVLLRQAVREERQNPAVADKLTRLKQAWR